MKRFQIIITNEHFTREVFVSGDDLEKVSFTEVWDEISACCGDGVTVDFMDEVGGTAYAVPSEILLSSMIQVTEVTEE